MANPHRGQVGFTVDNTPYTLRFGTNAICELEDTLNMGIMAIAQKLSDPATSRISLLRAAFWAGLREFKPDLTLIDAGNLFDSVGSERVAGLISEAFSLAFPQGGKSDKANPPPLSGTGPGS